MVKNFFVLAIFLVAGFLLFCRLDQPMIWQDEAEVTLLARNITKFGLPLAWDGQVLITQSEGQDSKLVYGGNKIWSWNTWLPHYATALSFKIFGESTAAARLPFALAALGILVVGYYLSGRSVVALLVLATNTAFYLYARQARYYAFSMLFPLGATFFYFRKKYFLFFLFLLASFHANFVLAFGFNLPLILISLKNPATRKYSLLFLAQAALWLGFFHPPGQYWEGLRVMAAKFFSYLNLINSFYFPLILGLGLWWWRKFSPVLKMLVFGCVAHLAVISFSLPLGQRYFVTLIPVFSLMMGMFLAQAGRKNILVLLILLPIFLFTNLPNIFSERIFHPKYLLTAPAVRFFLKDYVSSLFVDYPGPIEGITKFLASEKIASSQTIYTDYETNVLRFYFPNLKFVEHPSPEAAYFIPRNNWGNLNEYTSCQKQLIYISTQKITLPDFDTQWENMPDITYHQFTIDSSTPHVIIYKVTTPIDWRLCS